MVKPLNYRVVQRTGNDDLDKRIFRDHLLLGEKSWKEAHGKDDFAPNAALLWELWDKTTMVGIDAVDDQGKIQGFQVWSFFHDILCADTRIGQLMSIYLEPEYRGNGRQFVEYAVDQLSPHADSLTWLVPNKSPCTSIIKSMGLATKNVEMILK